MYLFFIVSKHWLFISLYISLFIYLLAYYLCIIYFLIFNFSVILWPRTPHPAVRNPHPYPAFSEQPSPVFSVKIICRFQPFPCLTKTVYWINFAKVSLHLTLVRRQYMKLIYGKTLPSKMSSKPFGHETTSWIFLPRFSIFLYPLEILKLLFFSISESFCMSEG